jgi:hypothetical protein
MSGARKTSRDLGVFSPGPRARAAGSGVLGRGALVTMAPRELIKVWRGETGAPVGAARMDDLRAAYLWVVELLREAKAEPGIDVDAYGPLLRLEMHFCARYRALEGRK